jgi:peptide subunit release factor 1 (eRF1)
MRELSTTRPGGTRLVDVPTAVEELGFAPSRVRTLSVYLDTSPSRIRGQAYLLSFRDRCRTVRGGVVAEDEDAFEVARAQAEHYLVDQLVPRSPGLALFASGESADMVVVALPDAPAADHIVWAEQPFIAPLEAMLDEHERLAVALFDAERARLFTVFLGGIETQQHFVDSVPGKQATGGWFGLEQTSFARHREDHLRRHAERTVHALMVLLRKRSFDRLLLAGPDEALAVLKRELPRPLRARLAGTLGLSLFASDSDVVEATIAAAESIERRTEEHLVGELLEAAATPHVVIGLAGTLNALADGRVHQLLVADSFDAPGGSCLNCNRLVLDEHLCAACGGETQPLSSLHEAVVERALAQGAKIETVSGVAAARLEEHEGVGAWTRF